MDILFISPADFHRKPQVGTHREMSWDDLCDWLSEPAWGDAKDLVGGWNPGLYTDNIRRKANLIRSHALVVDIDSGGDIDKLAEEHRDYDAILHETFSSSEATPRCRLVLRFAEPVNTETYEHVHRVIRRRIREELHVGVDDGAKDVSRLSYCPVRRPGSGYRAHVIQGRGLDAAALLKAHPPIVRAPCPVRPLPSHQSKYCEAALRRAADALAAGTPGERHDILNRESYALARLGLSLGEVARALIPAAIQSMGEARKKEIERTIVDGFMARKHAS